MEFQFNDGVITFNDAAATDIRILVVDNEPWFEAKPLARFLGYSNQKQVIQLRIDADCKKTIGELCGDAYTGHPSTIFINEDGFFTLVMASILPSARPFRRWVTGTLLPTIRRTGSFSMVSSEPEVPNPPRLTSHQQTRVDSIVLHDHLTDVLNELLDQIELPSNRNGEFFPKANDMCNGALLNLQCTTTAFKKQHGIPKGMSIPSVCSERQLIDMNMIRMQFINYIRDDAALLASMTSADELDAWFAEKRKMLTRMASAAGFHERTVDDLLSVDNARAFAKTLAKIRQCHRLPPSTVALQVTHTPTLRLLSNKH